MAKVGYHDYEDAGEFAYSRLPGPRCNRKYCGEAEGISIPRMEAERITRFLISCYRSTPERHDLIPGLRRKIHGPFGENRYFA
jgi:hypothetical protein